MARPPDGQLFSHVYLEHSAPARDSKRFRTRLTAYFWEHLGEYEFKFLREVTRELGITNEVSSFFAKEEVRDVLDSITLLTRIITTQLEVKDWISFVQRAFNEEGLGYRVDPKGGVHYVVDEELKGIAFRRLVP